MPEEGTIPAIVEEEILARFLIDSDWIRADKTIRQNAFIPYPHTDLSVTRHIRLTTEEIWSSGGKVADERKRELHGRADFIARVALKQSLRVNPDEPPRNHANLANWPAHKPAQKIIALELAKSCIFEPVPDSHTKRSQA